MFHSFYLFIYYHGNQTNNNQKSQKTWHREDKGIFPKTWQGYMISRSSDFVTYRGDYTVAVSSPIQQKGLWCQEIFAQKSSQKKKTFEVS